MFTWAATYKDGTILWEIDPITEKKSASEHIDRTKLRRFVLMDEEQRPVITQVLEPGQRFFFRRRVILRSDGGKIQTYIIGWRKRIGFDPESGKETFINNICFFYQDKTMEIRTEFGDPPYWDEPEWVPADHEEIGA